MNDNVYAFGNLSGGISSEYWYIGSCMVAFGYPLYDKIAIKIYTIEASFVQNSNRDLHF